MIEESILDINRKQLTHFSVRIVLEEMSQKTRNLQVDIGIYLILKNKLGKGLEEGKLPNQHGTYPCVNISFHVRLFLLSFLFPFCLFILSLLYCLWSEIFVNMYFK